MRAYRIVDGVGSVYVMEYTQTEEQQVFVERIKRAHAEESPAPRIKKAAEFFWQIEQGRPGGRVLVAVVIGPRLDGLPEPDWAVARLYAVTNPAPATSYGGTTASPPATFKRKRGSKTSVS